MGKLEQLYGPMIRGVPTVQISAKAVGTQWAGIATITSGAASVIVACTHVQSDSLIFALPRTDTAVVSGQARGLKVSSIAPGSSFIIGSVDNQAIVTSDVTPVMWMLWRSK
jgi:hypothetical protein